MVLEYCPSTQNINNFWKEKIQDHFSLLNKDSDGKFLSLKEYLTERPQKFYNQSLYYDYVEFLEKLKNEEQDLFIKIYREFGHEINIGIKALTELNKLDIHDCLLPEDNILLIRFIENNIHFNYLKLTEAVYYKFIYILANSSRHNRKKPTQGLDIYNCVEELKKTKFDNLTKYYNNTIRNGIAHGGITYFQDEIKYEGKKGKPEIMKIKKIISHFDNLLDQCNAMAAAFKSFIIMNRIFFQKNNLSISNNFLIQELQAQANAPKWKVIDCLESTIPDGRTQLNIFIENNLITYIEVNYYAFRTAILSDYFASGFDRYFFSLKSKYSLDGWAAYDGKILERERLNNATTLENYKGVLEGNLLFFVPKIKLPGIIRKSLNMLTFLKYNLAIEFHKRTDYQFKSKYELRDAKPFVRRFSLNNNDPSVVILPEFGGNEIQLIRKEYRKIVGFTIRKSRKNLRGFFSHLLPTNYIRVTVYDNDLRKRSLRNSGLNENLICSISINKSRKIKNIDFIGGKVEQKGKYKIVWNKNWSGFQQVC